MKKWITLWGVLIFGLSFMACGGARQTDFKPLVQDIDSRIGESVTLGGYMLDTRLADNQTLVVVLQAPLGVRGRPQSEDKSQGHFLVVYQGTLDPNDVGPRRSLTVTGTVLGTAQEKIADCPIPCLKIESSILHVWPLYEEQFWGRPTDGPGP
jgi:starvation-inducible outer membrane lipoprotein